MGLTDRARLTLSRRDSHLDLTILLHLLAHGHTCLLRPLSEQVSLSWRRKGWQA